VDASPWKQFRVTLMSRLWFDCLAAWKVAVVLRSLHGARRRRYSAHSGFLKPQRTSHMWTCCLCVRGPILQTYDRDQRQASSAVSWSALAVKYCLCALAPSISVHAGRSYR
jgi:hypothetical protein